MIRSMGTAVATAALGLGLALSPAQAVTIGFVGVNADQQNLSDQLSVDVTQVGGAGSNVQFVFSNLVGIASSVSEIYFDWAPDNLFSTLQHRRKQCSGSTFGQVPTRQSARGQHYFIRG